MTDEVWYKSNQYVWFPVVARGGGYEDQANRGCGCVGDGVCRGFGIRRALGCTRSGRGSGGTLFFGTGSSFPFEAEYTFTLSTLSNLLAVAVTNDAPGVFDINGATVSLYASNGDADYTNGFADRLVRLRQHGRDRPPSAPRSRSVILPEVGRVCRRAVRWQLSVVLQPRPSARAGNGGAAAGGLAP